MSNEHFAVEKSKEEWQKELTPEQYKVLREHSTERPFSSPLNVEKRNGMFVCAGCGQQLYKSDTKYESGSGWPSFYDAIPGAIKTSVDTSLGMARTEMHCSKCGGHLGHVFEDGPQPTGLRYCTNGLSLKFEPK